MKGVILLHKQSIVKFQLNTSVKHIIIRISCIIHHLPLLFLSFLQALEMTFFSGHLPSRRRDLTRARVFVRTWSFVEGEHADHSTSRGGW